jgi:hypothetical protein
LPTRALVGPRLQVFLNLRVAVSQLTPKVLQRLHRLLQRKEMLRSPIPMQRCRDLLLARLADAVAMPRQTIRITITFENRLETAFRAPVMSTPPPPLASSAQRFCMCWIERRVFDATCAAADNTNTQSRRPAERTPAIDRNCAPLSTGSPAHPFSDALTPAAFAQDCQHHQQTRRSSNSNNGIQHPGRLIATVVMPHRSTNHRSVRLYAPNERTLLGRLPDGFRDVTKTPDVTQCRANARRSR